MRWRRLFFVSFFSLGFFSFALASTHPDLRVLDPFPSQKYTPHEILVKLQPSAAEQIDRSLASHAKPLIVTEVFSLDRLGSLYGLSDIVPLDFSQESSVPSFSGTYRFIFARTSDDMEKLADIYEKDEHVIYAEPNYLMQAFFTPNDEFFNFQWNFHNTGSTNSDINLPAAWDYDTKSPLYGGDSGVVVAVIDTGVAYEDFTDGSKVYKKAPDFANTSFATGFDYVNNDTHPNDDNGHGTHVTGTIAQSTNNTTGVAGIAFNVTIMPIKALDAKGSGSMANVALAIDYAVKNGADLISMSLGGTNSDTLASAVKAATDAGVLIVAATGNDGATSIAYPAAYDEVIAVGATRFDAALTGYSNQGTGIDLVAPGGDLSVDQNSDSYADGILQQTIVMDDAGTLFTDETDPTQFQYAFLQGTSMATPHVTGVIALLLSQGVTSSSVQSVLQKTVKDLGDSGYDTKFGYGLLDAEAALKYIAASSKPAAPSSVSAYADATKTIKLETESSSYPYHRPSFEWVEPANVLGGVTGYCVSFSTDSAVDPATGCTVQIATNFTPSTDLSGNGMTYFLRVKTKSGFGLISDDAADFSYTVDTQVSSPSLLQASSVGTRKVTLSWTASSDGTSQNISYSLYRGRSKDNLSILIKKGITETSFLDTTPSSFQRYYYAVKAVDEAGNISLASDEAAVEVKSPAEIIVAPASGTAPRIKIITPAGKVKRSFLAYPESFDRGVSVASGDVDGDGRDEVITAPLGGKGQKVKIFSASGKLTAQFLPYSKNFSGGVTLASGDVDADGKDEIIVGTFSGVPQVRIFANSGKKVIKTFYAFSKGSKSGVRVASGDVDADGKDEIVVAPGKGAGPQVRIFNKDGKETTKSFFAYAKNSRTGMNLSVLDLHLSDDGVQIVTGTSAGASPYVRTFGLSGNALSPQFFAFAKGGRDGVNVASGDVNGDGKAEIIAAPPGSSGQIRVFDTSGRPTLFKKFSPYGSAFTGGVNIAVGDVE